MNKYFGLTHTPMSDEELLKWRKDNCVNNIHAFDEVLNSEGQHYLVCDACGLMVHIASIDTKFQTL